MYFFIKFSNWPSIWKVKKKKRLRVLCENFPKNQEKKTLKLKKKKELILNKKILLHNQFSSVFLLKEMEKITKNLNISSFLNYYFPFDFEEKKPSKLFSLLYLTINIEQDSFFGFQFLIFIWIDLFGVLPSIQRHSINKKIKLKENFIFEFDFQFEKITGGEIYKEKSSLNPETRSFVFVKNFSQEKSFFSSFSSRECIRNSYTKYLLISEKKKIFNSGLFSNKNLFLIYSKFLSPSYVKSNWGNRYLIHERWSKISFRSFFFSLKKKFKSGEDGSFLKKKKFAITSLFFKPFFHNNFYSIQLGKHSYRSLCSFYFNLSPIKILILIDDNVTRWDNLFQNIEKEKKCIQIFYLSLKINSELDYLQKLIISLKKKNFRSIVFMGNLENFFFSKMIVIFYLIPTLRFSKIFQGVNFSLAKGEKKVFFLIKTKKFLFMGVPSSFNFTNKSSLYFKNRKSIFNEIDFFILNSPLSPIIIDSSNLEFSNIDFRENLIIFIKESNFHKPSCSIDPYFFFSIIIISRWIGRIFYSKNFSGLEKRSLLSFIVLVLSMIENRYILNDNLRIKYKNY